MELLEIMELETSALEATYAHLKLKEANIDLCTPRNKCVRSRQVHLQKARNFPSTPLLEEVGSRPIITLGEAVRKDISCPVATSITLNK